MLLCSGLQGWPVEDIVKREIRDTVIKLNLSGLRDSVGFVHYKCTWFRVLTLTSTFTIFHVWYVVCMLMKISINIKVNVPCQQPFLLVNNLMAMVMYELPYYMLASLQWCFWCILRHHRAPIKHYVYWVRQIRCDVYRRSRRPKSKRRYVTSLFSNHTTWLCSMFVGLNGAYTMYSAGGYRG